MGYYWKGLNGGRRCVWTGRIGWWIFVGSAMVVIVGGLVGSVILLRGEIADIVAQHAIAAMRQVIPRIVSSAMSDAAEPMRIA